MIRTPPLTPAEFEDAKARFLGFVFALFLAVAAASLIWSHFYAV